MTSRAIKLEKKRIAQRAYRRLHPEKARESVRRAKAKKPAKYKKHIADWHARNPGKRNAYGRNWRKKNPEKNCDAARRWRKTPNGRLYVRRRDLLKRAAGKLDSAALTERLRIFGNECAYCGAKKHLHFDHLLAISKGGKTEAGNIVPACRSCNVSKGTKPWKAWYRAQPFYKRWRAVRIVRNCS